MSKYFTYAWKTADKLDRATKKARSVARAHRRSTWVVIGVAGALLVALILSLILVNDHHGPTNTRCYAAGSFDGLNIYLQSNRTTMQSCASAAKGAGLTNLSSLPPGVEEVCANATVTVFMKPVQAATVRDLGLNPASICS
jgi:hypothetical protein